MQIIYQNSLPSLSFNNNATNLFNVNKQPKLEIRLYIVIFIKQEFHLLILTAYRRLKSNIIFPLCFICQRNGLDRINYLSINFCSYTVIHCFIFMIYNAKYHPCLFSHFQIGGIFVCLAIGTQNIKLGKGL